MFTPSLFKHLKAIQGKKSHQEMKNLYKAYTYSASTGVCTGSSSWIQEERFSELQFLIFN